MPLPETPVLDRAGAATRSWRPRASVVDLLDRLIDCGVSATGNVRLGLAGIDLIALDLRLLLSSVETLERQASTTPRWSMAQPDAAMSLEAHSAAGERQVVHPAKAAEPQAVRPVTTAPPPRPATSAEPPADRPGEPVDRGLGRLIVAILELVHQLMERQALRRAAGGSLTAEQVERLGQALAALDDRMAELRDRFAIPPSAGVDTVVQVDDLLPDEANPMHARR